MSPTRVASRKGERSKVMGVSFETRFCEQLIGGLCVTFRPDYVDSHEVAGLVVRCSVLVSGGSTWSVVGLFDASDDTPFMADRLVLRPVGVRQMLFTGNQAKFLWNGYDQVIRIVTANPRRHRRKLKQRQASKSREEALRLAKLPK